MPSSPYFVAEMSANHLGSITRALKIADAAKQAGADALKLQTWTPALMVGNPNLVIESGPWAGRKMIELYAEAFTPWEWHETIMLHCEAIGLDFFSTAFDLRALDFLEHLGVTRHKISSFELVDLELVQAAAATGKPLILSTGMADLNDIVRAVGKCTYEGLKDITLLHCVSAYPCRAEEANLARMKRMMQQWNYPVGLSDHSLGVGVAVAATLMGASMIEKHLTLSRSDGGPDADFSLEPAEFSDMVEACKDAAAATHGTTKPLEHEAMRRSLWFAKDCEAGQIITREDLQCSRPATGLPPRALSGIIGAKLSRPVTAGNPVSWDDISI